MRAAGPPRKAVQSALQSVTLPAPVGGINTLAGGSDMPPSDCTQLYNMIAAEYGLRARLGYREWGTGLEGTADNQVRSIIPFTGSAANGANDRLFATTTLGVWDVTTQGAPVNVMGFAGGSTDAGHGVSHVVVTAAGHFLLYADDENGLHVYSEATDTWDVAVGITGITVENIVFVTVFKNRVWFVERNTGNAYYLDAGAIAGAATLFPMGAKFRAGGYLVGLWNWTIDGGGGTDDSLVAVSSGGDVLIWSGTDPASAATFGLTGVWYLGGVPVGRHIATNFGGDMLLMTRTGIVPLSRLIASGIETLDSRQYATAKISNLFNELMLTKATIRGWSMRLHPEDNALIVTVPTTGSAETTQLAMSMATRGWSMYRDLPIFSAEVFGGKMYFGTADGRVCISDGYVDGVELANPNTYTPVQWSLLTAFQSLGNGRQKRVHLVRPNILSLTGDADYQVAARYNFDLSELPPVSVSTGNAEGWDTALWDVATWGGAYFPSQEVRGTVGMGSRAAIAIRGASSTRTVLVDLEVFFDQGGML